MAGGDPGYHKNYGNWSSPDEDIPIPGSKISCPLGGLKQPKTVPSTLSLWLERFALCGWLGIVRVTKSAEPLGSWKTKNQFLCQSWLLPNPVRVCLGPFLAI